MMPPWRSGWQTQSPQLKLMARLICPVASYDGVQIFAMEPITPLTGTEATDTLSGTTVKRLYGRPRR